MENLISHNSGEKEGHCNRLDESDWTVTSWSDEVSHSFICKDEDLEIIQKALEKNAGKRKMAAKELGISERTLYRKIKQYDFQGITVTK